MAERDAPRGIEQINLVYDRWQDRLVLRVRCRDGSLEQAWLTRRLAKRLVPALLQVLDKALPSADPSIRRELLAYQHQEQVSAAIFDQPFREQGLPAAVEEPVLVSEVRLHGGGRQAWRIEFIGGPGRQLNLGLDLRSLHSLVKLLNDILPATGWDLQPLRPEGAMTATGHVTH